MGLNICTDLTRVQLNQVVDGLQILSLPYFSIISGIGNLFNFLNDFRSVLFLLVTDNSI